MEVIGMRLVNYQLKNEVLDAVDKYERDNNISFNIIVENFIEEFLYDKGYLTINMSPDTVKNPIEIYNERKKLFKVSLRNKRYNRVFYKDLYFGTYADEEVGWIIDNLSNFSDDELRKMDYRKWAGTRKLYVSFLKAKFENPLLTMQEYYNNTNSNIQPCGDVWEVRKSNRRFGSYNSVVVARIVRNFMLSKNWDEQYSSTLRKMKGEPYREWLFKEMEKEGYDISKLKQS